MKLNKIKKNSKLKNEAKAVKRAKKLRNNSGTKPVSRVISLMLAIVLGLAFILPACVSVWKMFFEPKTNLLEQFNSKETDDLLKKLEILTKDLPNDLKYGADNDEENTDEENTDEENVDEENTDEENTDEENIDEENIDEEDTDEENTDEENTDE